MATGIVLLMLPNAMGFCEDPGIFPRMTGKNYYSFAANWPPFNPSDVDRTCWATFPKRISRDGVQGLIPMHRYLILPVTYVLRRSL